MKEFNFFPAKLGLDQYMASSEVGLVLGILCLYWAVLGG